MSKQARKSCSDSRQDRGIRSRPELAPFTLAPRITDVTSERRRELRRQAEECGVRLIGLHWLLAKTEGLHLTSNDEAVRQRTAFAFREARSVTPKQVSARCQD